MIDAHIMSFELSSSHCNSFGLFKINVCWYLGELLINIHFLELVFMGRYRTIYTTCCTNIHCEFRKYFPSLLIVCIMSRFVFFIFFSYMLKCECHCSIKISLVKSTICSCIIWNKYELGIYVHIPNS